MDIRTNFSRFTTMDLMAGERTNNIDRPTDPGAGRRGNEIRIDALEPGVRAGR